MSENEEVKVDDIEEPGAEPTEDSTDWKAEAIKQRGIAKRNATRLSKLRAAKTEPVQDPNKASQTKQGFDYGEMAYLEAKGVADDDYPIVLEAMRATGKPLREALASKFVQAEIKEAKDARVSKDAIPSGSKRSASSARDTVEYWIEKGELPPDRELRFKVVAEKTRRANKVDIFSQRPIV